MGIGLTGWGEAVRHVPSEVTGTVLLFSDTSAPGAKLDDGSCMHKTFCLGHILSQKLNLREMAFL